jgi:pilus assembly protein Flp/PilA
MERALNAIRRFLRDEEGVTAIEYGLIAALIAVAIIIGAGLVGGNLNTLFTDIAGCLESPPTGAICGS